MSHRLFAINQLGSRSIGIRNEKGAMRKILSLLNLNRGFLMLGIETIIIYVLYWTINFMGSGSVKMALVISTIGIIVTAIITSLFTYIILKVQTWVQRGRETNK